MNVSRSVVCSVTAFEEVRLFIRPTHIATDLFFAGLRTILSNIVITSGLHQCLATLLTSTHVVHCDRLQSVPMETELKADCAVPSGNVFEPRFGWEAVHPEAPLLLSLCSGGPRTFTPEHLRRRQYAEHTALWKVVSSCSMLATSMPELS